MTRAARRDSTDLLLGASAVAALAALASALVSQHVFDVLPCAWCVLLRLIFVAIAAAALLGLLWRSTLGRRLCALSMLALAGCGSAAALWLHLVAAKSASCNLTLADRVMTATGLDGLLPQVFAAYASCADAQATLFGVAYEFWALALYLLLGAAAWRVLRRRR